MPVIDKSTVTLRIFGSGNDPEKITHKPAYTWRSIQQSDIPAIQKMLGDQETIHFVKLLN